MPVAVVIVLGLIAGIASIVLLYLFVLPESKRAELSPFLAFLHDFFNLKYLLVEKIFKFFYILGTCLCVGIGFFLLFGVVDTYWSTSSTFLAGLSILVLGPICMRISYELFMLTILLVKNTIEINNKLKGDAKGSSLFDAPIPTVPAFTPPQAPETYEAPEVFEPTEAPAEPDVPPQDDSSEL